MLTARIAVLVSGGGTNLQALIDRQGDGTLKSGQIALVIADKAGVKAISRADAGDVGNAVNLHLLQQGKNGLDVNPGRGQQGFA